MVAAAKTPDPVDVHVGARLRLRRLQVGMNQGALARAIKVTFQQVQKYERGTNRVSASRLYAACGVLRVKPGYFFEELTTQEPDDGSARDDKCSPAPLMTQQSLELVMLLPDIDPEVRGAVLRLARILAKGRAADAAQEDKTP
jgi:transcriptional regulator with XRE-family HTH domain